MDKKEKDEQIDGLNFGDYAIVDGHEYRFEKMPDVTWTIRPVTSEHELKRSRFMMHNRIMEDANGTRYEMPPTAVEIRNYEVALLFGGTDLKKKNGELAIKDNAQLRDVEKLVAQMPPAMVNELWVKIGEIYPKWGPSVPNDWKEEMETETI